VPKPWPSLFHRGGVRSKYAASADATIVKTTAISTLLVVKPDSDAGLNRLRQSGAWLTLDPQAVAACFNSRS